jgi:hypothetical protein
MSKVDVKKELGERFDRLPQWVQNYIVGLARERDEAVAKLDQLVDGQTKSAFYHDEYVTIKDNREAKVDGSIVGGPRHVRTYFQSRRITCEHGGVMVDIAPKHDDWHGRNGISIRVSVSGKSSDVPAVSPDSRGEFFVFDPKGVKKDGE